MNEKVDLADKLSRFTDHYRPRVVAGFNGNDVMVVKLLGEFVWHKHDDTDDFFLVLAGTLDIRLRDRTVTLGPGELCYFIQCRIMLAQNVPGPPEKLFTCLCQNYMTWGTHKNLRSDLCL